LLPLSTDAPPESPVCEDVAVGKLFVVLLNVSLEKSSLLMELRSLPGGPV
jgi:hypothetical protein